MKALTLPEHLMLLAMGNEEGAVRSSGALALPHGLNGALILELSLRHRVKVKQDILIEISSEPTGDEILDEALKVLEDTERDKTAEYWIARPDALVKDLRQRVLDRLVARGILQREEHRLLWLLPYERFPELDTEPERNLRKQLHDVVLHGAEADESTEMLITLIHACGLAEEVFTGEDMAAVRARLEALSEGSQIAKAITDDVAAATTAAVASSLASSVFPPLKSP